MIRGRFTIAGLLGSGVQGTALEVNDALTGKLTRVKKLFGRGESRYAQEAESAEDDLRYGPGNRAYARHL